MPQPKLFFLFLCLVPLLVSAQLQVQTINPAYEQSVWYVGKSNRLSIKALTADMQILISGAGASWKQINDSTIDVVVERADVCQLIIRQAGKILGAWQFKALFPKDFLSQEIQRLKSDKDCLQFINKRLKKRDGFYFDTVFTTQQIRSMKLSFKNWGVFDFNGDKKPDLYFLGKDRNETFFHWHEASLLLSDGDEYKEIFLLRDGGGQYDPILFTRRLFEKKLLFVYLFDLDNVTITDSLIGSRLYRYTKGIRQVDTLVYSDGNIINFAQHPSKLVFDSICYRVNWSQSCSNDSFTVYNDGRIKYAPVRCGRIEYEVSTILSKEEMRQLKNFVSQIDLANTNRNYSVSHTDDHTAITKIFCNGALFSFRDYGLESNYTLKAIYEYFMQKTSKMVEQIRQGNLKLIQSRD